MTTASKVIRVGDRFGRWTVLELKGKKAHCLCDCGQKGEVAKYNLKSLISRSCGCLRKDVSRELGRSAMQNHPDSRKKISTTVKKLHAEGRYVDSQKVAAESIKGWFTGKRMPGRMACGPENSNAKWWRIRSPLGLVIEGRNLNHLIKENPDLFEPGDAVFRKNFNGSERTCRAAGGLRALFRPQKPLQSWKGWTRA